MFRFAFRVLSPSGPRARLSILIFHRVLATPDPLLPDEPDATRFEELMRWVGGWFTVLPLPEAIDRLKSRSLPDRALCITFDDGYADNRTIALPILQKHRLQATFFIATGFLDSGRMWNDTVIEAVRATAGPLLDLRNLDLEEYDVSDDAARRVAITKILDAIRYRSDADRMALVGRISQATPTPLRSDLMMSHTQVRELHQAGMTVGAHTVTHPILASLDDRQAEREIVAGRSTLEDVIGAPVTVFAYPNGKPGSDFDGRHVELVKRLGFAGAVSTRWGAASSATNLFELPRFTPWDRSKTKFACRLVKNISTTTA